jgi:hypothetical protein
VVREPLCATAGNWKTNSKNERINNMAFGKVYVFNLYVEDMASLNLNNQLASAGTISSPDPGTKPPYTPQQLVVPRTNLTPAQLTGTPLFCNGPNSIAVNYGGEQWTGTITIPGPPDPAMKADLWLYICYKKAFLFETSGTMIPQQSAGGVAELSGGGASGAATLFVRKGPKGGGGAKKGASKSAGGSKTASKSSGKSSGKGSSKGSGKGGR